MYAGKPSYWNYYNGVYLDPLKYLWCSRYSLYSLHSLYTLALSYCNYCTGVYLDPLKYLWYSLTLLPLLSVFPVHTSALLLQLLHRRLSRPSLASIPGKTHTPATCP